MSAWSVIATWAPPVFGGLLAGSLLHELGHYLPAKLAGGEPRIRLRWPLTPIVEYDASDMHGLVVRVIQLAPLLSGVSAGALAYVLWGVPTGRGGVAALLAWFLYTFGGGAEDYLPSVAQGESWWWRELEAYEQLVYLAFATVVIGIALVSVGGHDRLAVAAQRMGQYLLLGGVLLFGGAAFVRRDADTGAQASRGP